MLFLVCLAAFWGVEGGNREEKRVERERGVVFFHPIPPVLFPSCYKLRERRWVSAEPVLVGWRGVEIKLLFHGGKRVLGRRERPSLLGGFRAATFLSQGWMWQRPVLGVLVPFPPVPAQIQEFLPEKGTLSFTTTNLPLIRAH